MKRINVWELKMGMRVVEDYSMVTSPEVLDRRAMLVLSDPKIVNSAGTFDVPLRDADGMTHIYGGNPNFSAYAPRLYLIENSDNIQ